jgi:hypothetical protein
LAVLAALGLLLASRAGFATGVSVPAELQAELFAKLASYDRNFPARARATATILVVQKPGSARSSLSAAALKSAFARVERVGGVPAAVQIVPYEGASSLVERCRSTGAAAVYLTAGLDEDVGALSGALAGHDVLSASAVPEHVPSGVVLGFELVSGKPKILVNLEAARRQNVSFKAEVLKLMKVFR